MQIGEYVYYNGHKLDQIDDGIMTVTRRKEYGKITKILPDNWIEVTLQSGFKVAMPEERMNICIEQVHKPGIIPNYSFEEP